MEETGEAPVVPRWFLCNLFSSLVLCPPPRHGLPSYSSWSLVSLLLCSPLFKMPLVAAPICTGGGGFFRMNSYYMCRCEFLCSTNVRSGLFPSELHTIGVHGSFALEATQNQFALRIPTGLNIIFLL